MRADKNSLHHRISDLASGYAGEHQAADGDGSNALTHNQWYLGRAVMKSIGIYLHYICEHAQIIASIWWCWYIAMEKLSGVHNTQRCQVAATKPQQSRGKKVSEAEEKKN